MYSCELCDFASSKRSNYNDHISTQLHIDNMCSKLPANTDLLCMKCNQFTTKIKNNFRRHVNVCKGINSKQDTFPCPVCKKEYQSKSGLFVHKRKGTCTPVAEKSQVVPDQPPALPSMSDNVVVSTDNQITTERDTTAIESLTEKLDSLKTFLLTLQAHANRTKSNSLFLDVHKQVATNHVAQDHKRHRIVTVMSVDGKSDVQPERT